MRFTLNTVRCAAVLALASGGLVQAALVASPGPSLSQWFVDSGELAPIARGSDGALFASAQAQSSTEFDSFDADRGVLVGASFSLALVDPNSTWLRTYAPEGKARSVTASFSAGWRILGLQGGAAAVTAAVAPMISYASDSDAGQYGNTTQWASTGFSLGTSDASALNGLVGASGTTITSRLDSALLVTRVDNDLAKADGEIQAYLTDRSNANVWGTLAGAAEYRYLHHAAASVMFDSVAADAVTLSGLGSSSLVTIVAKGSEVDTTGLDFLGAAGDVSCLGDCDKFSARFDAFNGLAAGGESGLGSIELLDDSGAFRATYTLRLQDTAGLGASDSQCSNWLTFSVDSGQISAVPEPGSIGLMLPVLLALGWLRCRRHGRVAGSRHGHV